MDFLSLCISDFVQILITNRTADKKTVSVSNLNTYSEKKLYILGKITELRA